MRLYLHRSGADLAVAIAGAWAGARVRPVVAVVGAFSRRDRTQNVRNIAYREAREWHLDAAWKGVDR